MWTMGQIRNPKPEIRNKSKIQIWKGSKRERRLRTTDHKTPDREGELKNEL
jgi:hypothetical protein